MSQLRDIQAQVSELMNRRRWRQARSALSAAFTKDPDDVRNHLLAAAIAFEEGDFETARRGLEKVLAANPLDFEGLFLLYKVQRGVGELGAAEKTILELLSLLPLKAGLYVHYADLMLSTLHIARARDLAREALRIQPDLQSAVIIEVLADVVEGRPGDARARLGALIRQDPENEVIAMTLAVVLYKQRRYLEAMNVVRGVLIANPNDGGVLDWVTGLAAHAHWTGIAGRPFHRFGHMGKLMVYLVGGTAVKLSGVFAPAFVDPLMAAWVAYFVYLVVQPGLTQRWIRARGVRWQNI